MASGKVRFWNSDKGWGFIIPDSGGSDIFAHIRDLRSTGIEKLVENQRVTFNTAPGREGKLKAVDIALP